MATEACDCVEATGKRCSLCNPVFKPNGIRILITLEGTQRGWGGEERVNEAYSSFYI